MTLYTDTKKKQVVIRLTGFQTERLEKICGTFGISQQRLFTDLLDNFTVSYWQNISGNATINGATKESAQELLDQYVNLKGLKGAVKSPYYPRHLHRRNQP
jgi:hypothetical protein